MAVRIPLKSNAGSEAEEVVGARPRMVTARAVLLALALMPVNALWVVKMEVTRYAGHPTTISLFFNVVFWLVLLLGMNALVRRATPRFALAPGELMTVYVMLGLASAVAGHDTIEVLTPILSHAFHYASPENGWGGSILPYIPPWLGVSDPEALKEFYNGTGSLYTAQNLRAWMTPVLCWTGLLTLLGFVMLCMNTLLRRQWTESERLAYPLVALPLEMVSPRTNLFRTPLFWLGVGVAGTLQLYNGLAFLYPGLPSLPLKWTGGATELNTYIKTAPWNAIGWTPIAVYPFGVALGMLLPLDLLFSTWFFSWVWRMERVAGVAYSLAILPGFPFVEAQSFGAYIGVGVFALWTSRSHFLRIVDGLFDRRVNLEDADEPLPYRWAVAGLVAGSAGLFFLCRACGMRPTVIIAFFGIYFLLAVAITRMRAELGPPAHDLHRGGPDSMLTAVMPPRTYTPSELGMFSLFYGFNRAYRGHPMPIQLEGFKIAEQIGGSYRGLFWAMLAAIFVGCLCGFWANIDQGYRYGAAARIAPPNVMVIFGGEPWKRMQSWLIAPPLSPEQPYTRAAIGFGFAVALLFNVLRLRFSWFTLHPVGYAVSSSWSLGLLWMPLAVAWVLKLLLLRYGGLGAYRKALPLFLGVIVGECVVGSLWTLVGILLDVPTYAFWP